MWSLIRPLLIPRAGKLSSASEHIISKKSVVKSIRLIATSVPVNHHLLPFFFFFFSFAPVCSVVFVRLRSSHKTVMVLSRGLFTRELYKRFGAHCRHSSCAYGPAENQRGNKSALNRATYTAAANTCSKFTNSTKYIASFTKPFCYPGRCICNRRTRQTLG